MATKGKQNKIYNLTHTAQAGRYFFHNLHARQQACLRYHPYRHTPKAIVSLKDLEDQSEQLIGTTILLKSREEQCFPGDSFKSFLILC